ncbi:MAG TPA: flagellar protein FlaG [Solimonas sp.]
MTEMIKAVEAMAASSGRGLDVVVAPPNMSTATADDDAAQHDAASHADADSVRRAIEAMSEQLAGHDVALSYRVDPELHRVIVEVVDRKDGSVLRQIPGEEAVRLARMMNSGQGGLLQATV